MSVEGLQDISSYQSSYEVIADLDTDMQRHLKGVVPYFVVGGIATAALAHPATVIDCENRRIHAADRSDIATRRHNGTLRDVDILIGSTVTPLLMTEIHQSLTRKIDGRLEVSVFGFDEYAAHASDRRGWISRRLEHDRTDNYYQLGPVIQEVHKESYQPWRLQLPAGLGEVSVLNPVGHLAAYAMRSISGIRAKDTEKFAKMRTNILQHPALQHDLHHGPFKEWKQFADTLTAIRRGQPLEHDNIQPGTTKRDIAQLRWRGRLLKMVEQHPTVVDVAQKPAVQKILNTFVRAAK